MRDPVPQGQFTRPQGEFHSRREIHVRRTIHSPQAKFIHRKVNFIPPCHSEERSDEESQNAVMLFRSEILHFVQDDKPVNELCFAHELASS